MITDPVLVQFFVLIFIGSISSKSVTENDSLVSIQLNNNMELTVKAARHQLLLSMVLKVAGQDHSRKNTRNHCIS